MCGASGVLVFFGDDDPQPRVVRLHTVETAQCVSEFGPREQKGTPCDTSWSSLFGVHVLVLHLEDFHNPLFHLVTYGPELVPDHLRFPVFAAVPLEGSRHRTMGQGHDDSGRGEQTTNDRLKTSCMPHTK